jgi:hypothetical protein
LETFTGTENYYQVGFGMKCTDGVAFIVKELSFPGILDLLALVSLSREFKKNPFRVLIISNGETGRIKFVMEDGNYNTVLDHSIISNKVLPVDEIVIWSEHDVFYVPSER